MASYLVHRGMRLLLLYVAVLLLCSCCGDLSSLLARQMRIMHSRLHSFFMWYSSQGCHIFTSPLLFPPLPLSPSTPPAVSLSFSSSIMVSAAVLGNSGSLQISPSTNRELSAEPPSKDQWLFQSEKKWDQEWRGGAWKYLENQAVERSRVAVIGGVFCQMFVPPNASVLDVGCGEGAISDFLTAQQQRHYVGIDISKEAIHLAKAKRGGHGAQKFFHATAHKFEPAHKFDVVIFSEVLYYVEHEKVIDQYLNYLTDDGIMIISIFHVSDQLLYNNIWEYARRKMALIDEVDIKGQTRKAESKNKENTALHIEVFRRKRDGIL